MMTQRVVLERVSHRSTRRLPSGMGLAKWCSGLTELLVNLSLSTTERLIELLREFPSEEPTRKRFIQEMIGWSGRYGPLERGDPELHHAAGSVYAEGWYISVDCYHAYHLIHTLQIMSRMMLRSI